MEFRPTSSCAVMEIDGMSGMTAKEGMLRFCSLTIPKQVRFHSISGKPNQIFTFYYFTNNTRHTYGSAFAMFIKNEKLGEVWESPALLNAAFHPNSKNQIWVWMPNVKALTAWYAENQPKPKEESVTP